MVKFCLGDTKCFLGFRHSYVSTRAVFHFHVTVSENWKLSYLVSSLIPWWLARHPPHTHQCTTPTWCNVLTYYLFTPILLGEHICIHGIWNWLPHMLHALRAHLGLVPCVCDEAWFMGFGEIMQNVWSCTVCKVALTYLIFFFLVPGRFIPSCDEDGYYRKQQCDRGECWCVDQNGGEVAGSRIRGKPDCGKSKRLSAVDIFEKTLKVSDYNFKMSAAYWPTSAQHPHMYCAQGSLYVKGLRPTAT